MIPFRQNLLGIIYNDRRTSRKPFLRVTVAGSVIITPQANKQNVAFPLLIQTTPGQLPIHIAITMTEQSSGWTVPARTAARSTKRRNKTAGQQIHPCRSRLPAGEGLEVERGGSAGERFPSVKDVVDEESRIIAAATPVYVHMVTCIP